MAISKNPLLTGVRGAVGDIVVKHENAKTTICKRGRINTSNSPAQQAVREQMRVLGAAFSALDGATQQMWLEIGLQMKPDNPNAVRKTLTAAAAFQSVNGLLGSLGQPYVNQPLGPPSPPEPLPAVQVVATLNGAVFTLRLLSNAYSGHVQVWATKGVIPGVNVFRKSAFKQIEVDDNLAAGGTSIGTAYVARFGVPKMGYKVGVRLVPVTPNGYKGLSVTAFGIVGPPSEGAALSGDDTDTSGASLHVG